MRMCDHSNITWGLGSKRRKAFPGSVSLCRGLESPWWLKQLSVCLQCRRPGFDPWVRKIPWRRKWQSTPVLLSGKSHGQRSLVGHSLWGCKKSDTTERLHFHFLLLSISDMWETRNCMSLSLDSELCSNISIIYLYATITVLITVALYYVLNQEVWSPPPLFFFQKNFWLFWVLWIST